MELTEAQQAALDHVRGRNPGRTPLHGDAPITVNFHPDRMVGGRTVIEGLLADGRFRSQFETGISNGGLTAYPGGDRDRWEERMFGGAYQRPGVLAADRPKYGALNLMHHDDGAAPRFGSAHLRLRAHVRDRATFTFGDSYCNPTEAGTADAFDAVHAALLAHYQRNPPTHHEPDRPAHHERTPPTHHEPDRPTHPEPDRPARHEPNLPARHERHPPARHEPNQPARHEPDVPCRRGSQTGRMLDDYVEAQIHGPVHLGEDVEALVLDGSFTNSGCGIAEAARRLSERYGVAVEWREAFRLAPGDIPAEFRGPEVPMLALLLCERRRADRLDAALIGAAARDVVADPAAWAAWGGPEQALQLLKYLWHCLVRFG